MEDVFTVAEVKALIRRDLLISTNVLSEEELDRLLYRKLGGGSVCSKVSDMSALIQKLLEEPLEIQVEAGFQVNK